VGLRLGACLALQTAGGLRNNNLLSQIVMWQPVAQGETFLNQFLRIRIAAALIEDGPGDKETVKVLRERLLVGETLEVAGYPLTPEMAAAIDALDITELALSCAKPLDWLELGSGAEPRPASRKSIDRMSSSGIRVDARVIPGEQFWNIEETTLVPALWQETATALARL
jgi:exosortase A-associated hydrolase 2